MRRFRTKRRAGAWRSSSIHWVDVGGERRLTPGQSATAKFPVVGERQAAPLALADWRLTVTGLVARPLTLALDELLGLPRVERVWDTICVTGWTHFDHRWGGVPLATLLDLADV